MQSYLYKPEKIRISNLSRKDFCRNSLCPKDYKELLLPKNSRPLIDFINNEDRASSINKGKEIGSALYMKKSKYRFLKTVNVTERVLYDQSSIEYCTKVSNFTPETGDVFIVKDGGGEGLGEVAYYIKNNLFTDFISAGIIDLKLKKEYKWYVLAFLKSQHFKDYVNVNTAQGSTIRHSKMIALDYHVPLPLNNSKKEIKYISYLMRNLLSKEIEIQKRTLKIDHLIENEIVIKKDKPKGYKITKSKISNSSRLDTGLYSQNYISINEAIENYAHGFYCIDLPEIKSGSTPKIRIFNGDNSNYLWVTPTDIRDEGFYNPVEKISMPTDNNIKDDCVLFINRTSKGKKGEFVGIACFYDHSYYGDGHHNQGIYRFSGREKDEQLFIVAFMNCKLMRTLCGCISLGSKMKEMKSKDFSDIKIPLFPDKIKSEISKLYYNNIEGPSNQLELYSYIKLELKRNKSLGIFQLNKEAIELKIKLEKAIYSIIRGKSLSFDLSYKEKLTVL